MEEQRLKELIGQAINKGWAFYGEFNTEVATESVLKLLKEQLPDVSDETEFRRRNIEKYSNISETAQLGIDAVTSSLKPVYSQYKYQIEGLSKEEANLIALEYIEELHTRLCMARIEEGIRRRKESKNK